MFKHKGYTVKRLSGSSVQVQDKRTKKAHVLVALVGDKGTPSCPCHKPGSCTHQEAVVFFCATERQPQVQPIVSMEDRLTWA